MVARVETMRRLVDKLNGEKTRGLRWPELRMGMVSAVNVSAVPFTVTLILTADVDFPIAGVPVLAGYYPAVNDVVWVFKNGTDLIVLGSLIPTRRPGRPPRCRLVKQSNQSIADGATWEAINFSTGSTEFDSHGMHSESSNISRITPNVKGLYQFKGQVAFDTSGTNRRDARLYKNGTTAVGYSVPSGSSPGSVPWVAQVSALVECNGSSDYVEVQCRQNSGGSLFVLGGTIDACHFEALWVAEDGASA